MVVYSPDGHDPLTISFVPAPFMTISFPSLQPSLSTSRSSGSERYLQSTTGFSNGSVDLRVTVPLDRGEKSSVIIANACFLSGKASAVPRSRIRMSSPIGNWSYCFGPPYNYPMVSE